MALVTVKCPECGRGTVVNGRGVCRCGARLWHHWRGKRLVPYPEQTWVMDNGTWRRYTDFG